MAKLRNNLDTRFSCLVANGNDSLYLPLVCDGFIMGIQTSSKHLMNSFTTQDEQTSKLDEE